MERERKIKRAKEREKNVLSPSLPSFFPALSLALVFACAPLSERLEQAIQLVSKMAIFFHRRSIFLLHFRDNEMKYVLFPSI